MLNGNVLGKVNTASTLSASGVWSTREQYLAQSNSTWPSAVIPDPSWTSVTTLLHGEGANNSTTITDSSTVAAPWSVSGGAKISTAAAKFGSSSILFPSSTPSYITSNSNSVWNFGTGSYTVEGWINMIATTGDYQVVADIRSGGNIYLLIDSSGVLTGFGGTGGNITLTAGTWTHFALCRSASTVRLFVNGVQSGSNYSDSTNFTAGSSTANRIGYDAGGAFKLNAYLDELRITKAARYTSNFTVPSTVFPDR